MASVGGGSLAPRTSPRRGASGILGAEAAAEASRSAEGADYEAFSTPQLRSSPSRRGARTSQSASPGSHQSPRQRKSPRRGQNGREPPSAAAAAAATPRRPSPAKRANASGSSPAPAAAAAAAAVPGQAHRAAGQGEDSDSDACSEAFDDFVAADSDDGLELTPSPPRRAAARPRTLGGAATSADKPSHIRRNLRFPTAGSGSVSACPHSTARRAGVCAACRPPTASELGVKVGQKLEAVDVLSEAIVAPATVGDIRNNNELLITFDGWSDAYNYWCPLYSPLLHPVRWCKENAFPLQRPGPASPYRRAAFDWDEYLAFTKATCMPAAAFCASPAAKTGVPGATRTSARAAAPHKRARRR